MELDLAKVWSRSALGVESPTVEVEVNIGAGLPHTTIVGLPAAAVRESKDRVRSAIENSGYRMPNGRLTINLAPADLPKHGTRFDLPMAVGIIAAMKHFPPGCLAEYEFVGELALDGALRPVRGVLPAALKAREASRALVVPADDAAEAALVRGATVIGASNLTEVCNHVSGLGPLDATPWRKDSADSPSHLHDLRDVCGQHRARRALELAAAGGHHLIFCGSPGTGKTMLATRILSILPQLDEQQGLECAALASVAGLPFESENWRQRPFRAPHHTASAPAVVGGGSQPRPGEISLAHNGVLFLDELPEFDRRVIEALREPLESRQAFVSRAEMKTRFPADFQLVAAMNPCPCGFFGDSSGRCRCTPQQVERYSRRISGPLLDRLDIHVETTAVIRDEEKDIASEDSATVRQRVLHARACQHARQEVLNSHLEPEQITSHAHLGSAERRLLDQALDRLGLSMRARQSVLRVALTIGDLAGFDRVDGTALTEALSYRNLDRRWR